MGQDRNPNEERGIGSNSSKKKTRPFKESDLNSTEFKKIFGKSEVVDTDGKPLEVFFGSESFGTEDSSDFWTFGARKGKETESPEAGLGHYFAEDRNEAMGFTLSAGKDLASLAGIAINSRYGKRNDNRRSTTSDLGFVGRTGRTGQERDLETKAGVSFSQPEVPTPSPATKKNLLSSTSNSGSVGLLI